VTRPRVVFKISFVCGDLPLWRVHSHALTTALSILNVINLASVVFVLDLKYVAFIQQTVIGSPFTSHFSLPKLGEGLISGVVWVAIYSPVPVSELWNLFTLSDKPDSFLTAYRVSTTSPELDRLGYKNALEFCTQHQLWSGSDAMKAPRTLLVSGRQIPFRSQPPRFSLRRKHSLQRSLLVGQCTSSKSHARSVVLFPRIRPGPSPIDP